MAGRQNVVAPNRREKDWDPKKLNRRRRRRKKVEPTATNGERKKPLNDATKTQKRVLEKKEKVKKFLSEKSTDLLKFLA
jgi:hypothetical protein